MPEFSLTVEQASLLALRRRLKDAGEKGLTKELNKALRLAAKPIAEAAKPAALALPSSRSPGEGSLRRGLAAGVRVVVTTSSRNPGVRVKDVALLAKASTSRGWRHRVYGHNVWVNQTLGPGWFDTVAKAHKAEVGKEVHLAVERVARKIAGHGI